MVSFMTGEGLSENGHKKRRTCGTETLSTTPTPGPGPELQTARPRKQSLVSKLGDSGFEEDLGSSPVSSSPVRRDVSPPGSEDLEPVPVQLSSWYRQYGDVAFRIQRDQEAHFHLCRSLAQQPQLNTEARCTLVSWLISVHHHFRLSFECCCLAVNIVDRFLVTTPVAADCFQLLGVTALLLASKQVEVCSPGISHLLSLCCGAFTKEQLCNLECLILVRLNFRLAAPTHSFFLDYYTNCVESAQHVARDQRRSGVNPDTLKLMQCRKLAQKVCELSLADYAFNVYPPSLTAFCALRLAMELLTSKPDISAIIQSGEKDWEQFLNELNPQILFSQPCESPDLSVGQESHNHSLAQECKDNLKMLVSLNQDTLEGMFTN